jgi:hypothetical protein
MVWKTVQIFDPAIPMDLSPEFDRTAHRHEASRVKLTDLVERNELPRYRGDETEIIRNDNEIVVKIAWNSQAVAQEYADWAQSMIGGPDDPNHFLLSVSVVDEP